MISLTLLESKGASSGAIFFANGCFRRHTQAYYNTLFAARCNSSRKGFLAAANIAAACVGMLDLTESRGEWTMSRRETESDHGLVTETKKKVKRPPLYKVLLHNDDYTTKEFVVQILQYVFHKEQTEAVQIMLHVHKKGIGVAGVYSYEIAETKVTLVENLARQHEYPLKCTMEEA
jgi:ATP-dependent Clp protease adaptor protein ClpS